MKKCSDLELDREMCGMLPEQRWREWMRRIEAILFAFASPVPSAHLARVVGEGAGVDLLIEDLKAETAERSYHIVPVADGWMLHTRPAYANVIQAAADVDRQYQDLNEFDLAVLAAVAYHQPITRDGPKDIFGKDINRDLIGRLHAQNMITTGPRSPRRRAPYTFVTTQQFLVAFDLQSLRDLPDHEQLSDAGLAAPSAFQQP